MKKSKISSRTTYNKCIKDLSNYGYIEYQPSFQNKGSKVNLDILISKKGIS